MSKRNDILICIGRAVEKIPELKFKQHIETQTITKNVLGVPTEERIPKFTKTLHFNEKFLTNTKILFPLKENHLCDEISINIYENKDILINDINSKRDFVKIQTYGRYKEHSIPENYYILYNKNNVLIYLYNNETPTKKLKFIKEYKELTSDVFSDVFNLLIDKYRKLNLIK